MDETLSLCRRCSGLSFSCCYFSRARRSLRTTAQAQLTSHDRPCSQVPHGRRQTQATNKGGERNFYDGTGA